MVSCSPLPGLPAACVSVRLSVRQVSTKNSPAGTNGGGYANSSGAHQHTATEIVVSRSDKQLVRAITLIAPALFLPDVGKFIRWQIILVVPTVSL